MERLFNEIVDNLSRKLMYGRKIEAGRLTVNVAALMAGLPRVVVREGREVRPAKRLHIPEEGFVAMRHLLSDDDVRELRSQGLHKVARRRRVLNRRIYRFLLRLYLEYTIETFQWELAAYIQSGQAKRITEFMSDTVMLHWHAVQLRLAAAAHFLRIADPCALVEDGMRGTAFIINQLAVEPASWK